VSRDWSAVEAVGDVSRETLSRLEVHLALLEKWNRRINLVSRGSLPEAVTRHYADSAQLWRLAPTGARVWLDLGAGAGFPGLVVAAIAAEASPTLEVRLVESDLRKAAFLRAAVDAMRVRVTVLDCRIESLPPQDADVVSARALAPLGVLLEYVENHSRSGGIGLFPKGETVHKEIEAAAEGWRFEHQIHPSLTEPRAAIVEVGAIRRV
jgi:16S rRNA (guanine527-N7)-methyltransferase